VSGGCTQGGYSGVSNGMLRFRFARPGCEPSTVSTATVLRPTFDWTDPDAPPENRAGQRRAYHTATCVFTDGVRGCSADVLLFGGFDEDGAVSSLEHFNVELNRFIRVASQTGTSPCPRFGHSSARIQSDSGFSRLLISGGSTEGNNMKSRYSTSDDLSDQYLLDVRRDSIGGPSLSVAWTRVETRIHPKALQRLHSATVMGSRIVFFGGGGTFRATNITSVLFNSDGTAWAPCVINAKVGDEYDNDSAEMDSNVPDQEDHGTPARRQNHCAAWMGDDTLLIAGGCRALPIHKEELCDAWLLDFSKASTSSSSSDWED